MPKPIRDLSATILKSPAFVSVNPKEATVREIQQYYYIIGEHERDDAIVRLLDSLETRKSLIFCRTKAEVDRLGTMLQARGYFGRSLHGDMEQRQREEVIGGFRAGSITILVATDVAARGLDIADVTHVFNYHIPFDTDSYVHRIGRTGRAGRKGMAVTLVTPHEYQGLKRIQGTVGRMQLGFIPTRKDLRHAVATRLLDTVREKEMKREAQKLVDELAGEMDLAELSSRMLTLLLERETITGPERIGLDLAAVERLQRPKPAPSKPYGKPKPGQRPYPAARKAGKFGASSSKPSGKFEGPAGKPKGKFEGPAGKPKGKFEGPAGKPKGKFEGKPAGFGKPKSKKSSW